MRNKIVLLIALVIIAGGLGWGWKMMKKGNTGKWREYRSTTGGFRLDYPEKWEGKEYIVIALKRNLLTTNGQN